jgi:hypothetical protein
MRARALNSALTRTSGTESAVTAVFTIAHPSVEVGVSANTAVPTKAAAAGSSRESAQRGEREQDAQGPDEHRRPEDRHVQALGDGVQTIEAGPTFAQNRRSGRVGAHPIPSDRTHRCLLCTDRTDTVETLMTVVFVTGGAGFIGSAVVRRILRP